ncbi:45908_t:CDS:2, partial [Gigaspora margarita]
NLRFTESFSGPNHKDDNSKEQFTAGFSIIKASSNHSDYLLTDKEIESIIESSISKNTRKVMKKWVTALNRWCENVRYHYDVETISNKDQLEKEMTEFFCGVQKVQNGSDYSLSSLTNAYNCLSNYISKHPKRSNTFTINNKNDFSLLWKALNGKMKALKKSEKVTKHHDLLTPEELKQMFNHEALSINTAKGLQYRVFIWCCLLFAPQGGEHSQMKVAQFDSLVIPVPADPEGYLGPIHNIKLYLSKRPKKCTCEFLHLQINKNVQEYAHEIWYSNTKLGVNTCNNLMKSICNDAGINIENCDIVNHSGRTTPITFLFREGIPVVTSMSITGHKSESSYQIYSRPSKQQKKNVLSTLINVINLSESQDLSSNNDHDIINDYATIHEHDDNTIHDHNSETIHDHDSDTIHDHDTTKENIDYDNEENTDFDTAEKIQLQ